LGHGFSSEYDDDTHSIVRLETPTPVIRKSASSLVELDSSKPPVRVLTEEEKSRGGHLCAEESECPFQYGVCCEGGTTCCKHKCVKSKKSGKAMCLLDDMQKELLRRKTMKQKAIKDEEIEQEGQYEADFKRAEEEKAKAMKKEDDMVQARQEQGEKKKKEEGEKQAIRLEEAKKEKAEQVKENQREDVQKKNALALARCRKKTHSPSNQAGQFFTPVFRYPNGWHFSGGWSWDSFDTITGDFDGDGKSDFARLGTTYGHFFISKGDSSFFTPIFKFPKEFSGGDSEWFTIPALDLNGDGRSDFVRAGKNSLYVFISQGPKKDCFYINTWADPKNACFQVMEFKFPTGYSMEHGHGKHWRWPNKIQAGYPSPLVVGDINGDGNHDFALMGADRVRLFISKGDGTFWLPEYAYPNQLNFGWDQETWTTQGLDLNGDCRLDLLKTAAKKNHAFISTGGNEHCWHKNGLIPSDCFKASSYEYKETIDFCCKGKLGWESRHFVVGDFNGDHFQDFAHVSPTHIYYFISKGDGSFHAPTFDIPKAFKLPFNEEKAPTLPAADFDGDGRADIVRTTATYNIGFFSRGTDQRCWKHDGNIPADCVHITVFKYPAGWHFSGGWSFNRRSVIMGDFNGDGYGDFINLGGPTYNHQFYALPSRK